MEQPKVTPISFEDFEAKEIGLAVNQIKRLTMAINDLINQVNTLKAENEELKKPKQEAKV
jgi:hypothetical protein